MAMSRGDCSKTVVIITDHWPIGDHTQKCCGYLSIQAAMYSCLPSSENESHHHFLRECPSALSTLRSKWLENNYMGNEIEVTSNVRRLEKYMLLTSNGFHGSLEILKKYK